MDEMVDRLLDILADKLTERLSAGHKELYTAKELAERYGVSCATIRSKMAAGEFGELVSVGERTRLVPWAGVQAYPSTTYNTFILPTIRRGSVGDVNRTATKMLQRLLGLTPDGIFGEKTENALLKAQEKHKLAVDGICGPASWRAISGANKYL